MLRFHYPKDAQEEKSYHYHKSNFYNGSSRRYDNLNYVDRHERRVSYEEKHRQREVQELRRALKQMKKNLDEWFENFNLEEAVKKLERSKAKVVNADDAKVDDDNMEVVQESKIKVKLEEEEKKGDIGEEEMVVAKDSHSFLVEESCVDSCMLALEPLPRTPGANDRHRYFYILIPSFNLLYSDLLMGLGGGVDYRDCIMPVRSYVVCVGIHWSIYDGFMYWRSVLLVGGAIVVQEMTYEWEVRRLLLGVNDSGIAMKSESYCDFVMDVTYLNGVHWNYVEGWMFCAPYDNPYVKYLYMGLLKGCIWDPGWISEHWDWNMFIHHLGVGYVLVYGYFGRLFIPQDSLRCQSLRCWFCLCYSIDFLHWVGVNLGDRGKAM